MISQTGTKTYVVRTPTGYLGHGLYTDNPFSKAVRFNTPQAAHYAALSATDDVLEVTWGLRWYTEEGPAKDGSYAIHKHGMSIGRTPASAYRHASPEAALEAAGDWAFSSFGDVGYKVVRFLRKVK